MMYSDDDRYLADEVCRYTHPFKVPHSLLQEIVSTQSKIDIDDSGELLADVARDQEEKIDEHLNSIFWRDINPFLSVPLSPPDERCTSKNR
jgi:hypothetical protein